MRRRVHIVLLPQCPSGHEQRKEGKKHLFHFQVHEFQRKRKKWRCSPSTSAGLIGMAACWARTLILRARLEASLGQLSLSTDKQVTVTEVTLPRCLSRLDGWHGGTGGGCRARPVCQDDSGRDGRWASPAGSGVQQRAEGATLSHCWRKKKKQTQKKTASHWL